MTADAEDMVLVPRAELDALRAENRRLRREAGDREALKRIRIPISAGRRPDLSLGTPGWTRACHWAPVPRPH